jgi:alkanesulfonate monooxygenase SsuD/methylene tetrahydromethanopterin reductase-like flavin-dependent oxidoreductase (luciferase family)
MECDYREGVTQDQAFQEAFQMAELSEECGLDGVWLAERHFAAPRGPLDSQGAGIPSIVSVPMIMASAIAARTRRLRVGIAVSVLPLCHPIRMAEEAATVDNISQGRFDFGIGRSGFARAYEGYGIPYGESRELFQESLEVIVKAWTTPRLDHQGKYYNFSDVCVMPRPYQQPHPPIRIAATTRDTFPQVGRMGHPIFVGLRGMDRPEVARHLSVYREAWREAGHPKDGDVILRIPVYVAETEKQALSEPEVSTMSSYRRMAENFSRSAAGSGTTVSEERAERGRRLANVTYEDLLRDRVAYGTPDAVAEQIKGMQEELGLSGVIAEMNVGGLVPKERVLNSLRLFGEQVVPHFK